MAISNPSDIANLLTYYDAGITASITASGSNVTAFAGQAGPTLNDVSGSVLTGVNTLNGLNVMTFNGTGRIRQASGAGGTTPFTMFAVAKSAGSTGGNQWVLSGNGADGAGLLGVEGGNWAANAGAGAQQSGAAFNTQARRIIIVCNGGSSAMYVDGTQYAIGDPGTNGIAADAVIGANAFDSGNFNGDFAGGGTYSRVLNSTEIADLDAWMAARWFGSSAATLSNPTPSGTIGTQTTATCGATTNQSSGTLYVVASATQAHITGITAAQVVAGQTSSGGAAPFSNSAGVSTATPSVGLTSLSGSTLYYYALAQVTSGGNSNVITGSFTTAASTRSVSVTLYGANGSALASTNVQVWTRTTLQAVATDGGAGGLDFTTNGSGVLAVTGLSIAAGAGWLTVTEENDNNNSHNYPVTFV